MKLARYALMVLAMIGAVTLARAEDEVQQAGEVTYTIPPGWERAEKERIVVLTPKGSSPEQVSLVITPGETLAADGNFPKWFKDKWEGLRKEWKVVQGGERTGQEGPLGSSVLYQAAMLEAVVDGKPARTGLLLYAVHIGDAVHWVVFRTEGAKPFNQHKKTVNAFLGALKFAEAKKPEPPGLRKKPAEPPTSDRAQPPKVLEADPK